MNVFAALSSEISEFFHDLSHVVFTNKKRKYIFQAY